MEMTCEMRYARLQCTVRTDRLVRYNEREREKKEGLVEPQTTATIRVHGSDKFTFRRQAYPSRSVYLKRLRSGRRNWAQFPRHPPETDNQRVS